MKNFFGWVASFAVVLVSVLSVSHSAYAATATSTALSWNSAGTGYKYSLDITTKDGRHIGPCIPATVIGSATKVIYAGVCKNATKDKVAVADIANYTLVYTNTGNWVSDAHSTKILNDSTKSALVFSIIPPGSVVLSWNSLGAGYQYSLDITTKDGRRIGPCISAVKIGATTTVMYTGVCQNKTKDAVSLANVDSFILVYTNTGNWATDAHNTTIKNNNANTQTLALSLSCVASGTKVPDGSSVVLYTTPFSTPTLSCSAAAVKVSCTRGSLSTPADSLYAQCGSIITTPFPVQPGGAPGVTVRKDGALLAAYNHIKNKVASMDTYLSKDNGATWTYLSTIVSAPIVTGTQVTIANAFLRQLSNGTIIASYRYHDGPITSDTTAFKTFRLQTKVSTDGGLTWGPAATIEEIDNTVPSANGLWEPYINEMPNATLQAYYAKEHPRPCATPGVSQDVVMRESTDGGATWGGPHIALSRGGSREGVPSVVQAVDGTLFAAFETWRGSDCSALNPYIVPGLAMSTDGGMTWQYLPDIYTGEPTTMGNGWPDMLRLKDGRILVRFSIGSSGTTPQVALMISTNVPSKTAAPIWRTVATSGISVDPIGKLAQLPSGDVVSSNSNGAAPVSLTTIPLALLKAPTLAMADQNSEIPATQMMASVVTSTPDMIVSALQSLIARITAFLGR
jgi:hypothetical protein